MASYDLPLPAEDRLPEGATRRSAASYLSEGLLFRSVLWFCRLRWAAVGLLVLFGAVGLFPDLLARFGLQPHPEWPFVAAAVLSVANLGFLAHARILARSGTALRAAANLWIQIIVDLLVVTAVVHYVGSVETYVAFAYLFHIALACIFFPRPWSLAVTALACVLYIACVVLEETRVIPTAGIYAEPAVRQQIERVPGASVLNVTWATVTWVVVWYLASHLSAMVRQRDSELAETNRRLMQAQEEKMRHMLSTTHELKAPFAAIDANVQLLLKGHCGDVPEAARGVLQRIDVRCRRLALQIQEMLQLANLQATSGSSLPRVRIDLAGVIRRCIAQIRPMAKERGVSLKADLQPAHTVAVRDHLEMLFSNLLSNAVHYSRAGGQVEVCCGEAAPQGPVVTLADQGIGIQGDKLPRIFDAYYRADEAVRHHRESTGLGLAIVRHIAEAHGIRVRVESEAGLGTKFTLRFPPPEGAPAAEAESREVADGVPADCGR